LDQKNKPMNHSEIIHPWYKEPWFWFVVGLPFSVVVAAIVTFNIAIENPVSLVVDNYYKKGLGINQQLELQAKAANLSVIVTLSIDENNQLLLGEIKANQSLKLPSSLSISFFHPTLEKYDRIVLLEQLVDNEYVTELPILTSTNWHVQIFDKVNQWQIKGRWQLPSQSSISLSE